MKLHKNLLAAAVAAGLGLSTVAIASPWGSYGPMMGGGGDCPMMKGGGYGPMAGSGRHGGRHGQRHAMMQQYRAERMELLEARLKLKPEQETAWKGFLAAQDAHHAIMFKTKKGMRGQDETALAHFEGRVQAMEQNLAGMKDMLKATGDLYAALDSNQKQVMDHFFTNRPMARGPGRGSATDPAQSAHTPPDQADGNK